MARLLPTLRLLRTIFGGLNLRVGFRIRPVSLHSHLTSRTCQSLCSTASGLVRHLFVSDIARIFTFAAASD